MNWLKPNFLVIGASKAASTSLSTLLGRHPAIFCISRPEPSFFNSTRNYEELGWPWYAGLFTGSERFEWRGEKSNRYTERERFPGTVERIRRDLSSETRFFYIVRDPITRIESMWLQKRSHGAPTHHEFARAVREEDDWYGKPCNYLRQLEPYFDHFPRENFLVLFFEDFRRAPEQTARQAFQFLGVKPTADVDARSTHLNPTAGRVGDTASLGRLRSLPFYDRLRRTLPTSLRHAIKERYFRRPMRGRPEWPPDLRRWLYDRLAEDTVAFLRMQGKPVDFWSLTEEPPLQASSTDCP